MEAFQKLHLIAPTQVNLCMKCKTCYDFIPYYSQICLLHYFRNRHAFFIINQPTTT